jgi:hypothetical protein
MTISFASRLSRFRLPAATLAMGLIVLVLIGVYAAQPAQAQTSGARASHAIQNPGAPLVAPAANPAPPSNTAAGLALSPGASANSLAVASGPDDVLSLLPLVGVVLGVLVLLEGSALLVATRTGN